MYYHVNALAGAGILEVLETRKKGTQLEKIYRVAGTTIRPGPDVFTQAGGPRESAEAAATLVLDTTRVELVEALTRHAENGFEPDQRPGAIGRSLASLPAHLIPKFVDRLNALVHDLANSETDDGIPVTFTYVLLPGTSDNTELKKENES